MAVLLRYALGGMTREEAKSYFDGWSADLTARLILNDLIGVIYVGPGDTEVNAAVASLWHAEYYLEDRIGYEMDPAPKGMIRLMEERN